MCAPNKNEIYFTLRKRMHSWNANGSSPSQPTEKKNSLMTGATIGRYGSFHLWMHVWVAGKTVSKYISK